MPPSSTKIHVVCIPALGNETLGDEVNMIDVRDITATTHSGTHDAETVQLEKKLRYVPDIMKFRKPALFPWNRKPPAFKWHHRILAEEVVVSGVAEKRKGRYYMYKCTDPGLGLPENRLFYVKYGCTAYGDAFIFILKESESESGKLEPAEMDWLIDWYDIRFFLARLAKQRDPPSWSRQLDHDAGCC